MPKKSLDNNLYKSSKGLKINLKKIGKQVQAKA